MFLEEDNDDPIDYGSLPAVELSDLIEEQMNRKMKKSTKEYKELKHKINSMIAIYNKKVGQKIYNIIK